MICAGGADSDLTERCAAVVDRDDGVGPHLGKTHTIAGESEAGKDWAAQCASADEMKTGNHVVLHRL
jgi:hypothetical protein